jgi:hypothetical protein
MLPSSTNFILATMALKRFTFLFPERDSRRTSEEEVASGEWRENLIGVELLIPAGAIHSARNIGATTARWLFGYKR